MNKILQKGLMLMAIIVNLDASTLKELKMECNSKKDKSCTALGYKYIQGKEVRQDYNITKQYFEKAMWNDPLAQFYLGMMYRNGLGVAQDFSMAKSKYILACNFNIADACSALGYMYSNGMGVEKDYAKANGLNQKACEEGSALGCLNIGMAYVLPQGVKINYTEAVKYFKLACNGGVADGCSSLGVTYERGLGVSKNFDLSKLYYKEACEYGNENGCANYRRITR